MLIRTVRNIAASSLLVALVCIGVTLPFGQPSHAATPAARQGCVDYSSDPAGCQPSTFATPTGQMPSRRVGRDGKIDAGSSEADARTGAALDERKLTSAPRASAICRPGSTSPCASRTRARE